MKKKLRLLLIIMMLPIGFFAQENEFEYELNPKEKEGWIIDKKGNKIEGIVKLMGSFDRPWINQQKVRFIAKTSIDPNKKRQKLQLLDVNDLQAYAAYDQDVLRQFELIKYTNFREANKGRESGGIGGKIKALNNLTASTAMAETIVKGPITVYKLYGIPTSIAANSDEIQQMEKDIRNIKMNPSILVAKNSGKVEPLSSKNFKKLTEDCEHVRAKMLQNEYASYRVEKEEKKRSKIGSLIKDEAELDSAKIQNMAVEIFTDYNANCSK